MKTNLITSVVTIFLPCLFVTCNADFPINESFEEIHIDFEDLRNTHDLPINQLEEKANKLKLRLNNVKQDSSNTKKIKELDTRLEIMISQYQATQNKIKKLNEKISNSEYSDLEKIEEILIFLDENESIYETDSILQRGLRIAKPFRNSLLKRLSKMEYAELDEEESNIYNTVRDIDEENELVSIMEECQQIAEEKLFSEILRQGNIYLETVETKFQNLTKEAVCDYKKDDWIFCQSGVMLAPHKLTKGELITKYNKKTDHYNFEIVVSQTNKLLISTTNKLFNVECKAAIIIGDEYDGKIDFHIRERSYKTEILSTTE